MKWDKQVAVDAIRAYYDSIELTVWAESPQDAVKRYWRSAQCKKGRVYAFVDHAKLMRAVDAIYENSFVAANFVRKTIEERIGNNCIVRFVDGGETVLEVSDKGATMDDRQTYEVQRRMGIGTVITQYFGTWDLQTVSG